MSQVELERKRIRDEVLDRRIQDFIKRYEPHDEDFRSSFGSDFIRIVQEIYHNAQAPFIEALSANMNVQLNLARLNTKLPTMQETPK